MKLQIERNDLLISELVYSVIVKRNEIQYIIHKNRITGKSGLTSESEMNVILKLQKQK